MAASDLSSIRDGKLADKHIVWSYTAREGTGEASFFWNAPETRNSESAILCVTARLTRLGDIKNWHELEAARIIGITLPSKTSRQHLLLGLTGKDADVSLLAFELDDPPAEFVNTYELPFDTYLQRFLASDARKHLHVIVSIKSGTGNAAALSERALLPLLNTLSENSERYNVHNTTSEESVIELAKTIILPAANDGNEQLIIILSGDGGVIDVLNSMYSQSRSSQYRRPTIALLPMGTGNALANSSGILQDKTSGLRSLCKGRPHELPVFRATFSPGARHLVNEAQDEAKLQLVDGQPTVYGAVVCSWGLHAALVADSDTTEYRKFGAERFKMAAKENLFPADNSLPHAYRGTVSIMRSGQSTSEPWKAIDRSEHGYVLATLVSNLEAGFTISPSSKPLDGVLRVVHFRHISGNDAMQVMGKAYQGGKHVEDSLVGYEAVTGLRIEFNEDEARWRRVCIDGKIVRVEKGGWVEARTDTESIISLLTI